MMMWCIWYHKHDTITNTPKERARWNHPLRVCGFWVWAQKMLHEYKTFGNNNKLSPPNSLPLLTICLGTESWLCSFKSVRTHDDGNKNARQCRPKLQRTIPSHMRWPARARAKRRASTAMHKVREKRDDSKTTECTRSSKVRTRTWPRAMLLVSVTGVVIPGGKCPKQLHTVNQQTPINKRSICILVMATGERTVCCEQSHTRNDG